MLNTLKPALGNMYTITRRIVDTTDNKGYITFKSITQSVHFKYEELYTKFIRMIEMAKDKINADIIRNKSNQN